MVFLLSYRLHLNNTYKIHTRLYTQTFKTHRVYKHIMDTYKCTQEQNKYPTYRFTNATDHIHSYTTYLYMHFIQIYYKYSHTLNFN